MTKYPNLPVLKILFVGILAFVTQIGCASRKVNSTVSSDIVFNLKTVSAMKNYSAFSVGDLVRTQGYWYADDKGSAFYRIENRTQKLAEREEVGEWIELNQKDLLAKLVVLEQVNVKQFGATGNGKDDDYLPIQRAIDYCQKKEIKQLWFPSGNYMISKSLTIKNYGITELTKRPSGLDLLGNGTGNTSIMSFAKLEGSLIKINGSSISSSYINGGTISDIQFDGGNHGDKNSGVEFTCWWNGSIQNCKFENFTGDALKQTSDFTKNSNPDFTASVGLSFTKLIIQYCAGFGFNNSGLQGAPGYNFENCIFTACAQGGAYVQSSSYRFITCSFSANGWRDTRELSRGSTDAFGIHFGGSSATVNSRHIIEGCEFDNNKTAHIACSYLSNSRFINNRFIHEYRGDKLHPPGFNSILLAPYSHDETLRNLEFTSNYFRFKSQAPCDMHTAIMYDWKHNANVQNVYIKMNTISNNSNPSNYLTIIPFQGFDDRNMHLKNNYVIDNNGVGSENDFVSFGTPPPFYKGKNSCSLSKIYPKKDLTLLFDIPDPLFDEKGNFQNTHYNTLTGIFKVPYSGYYEINVQQSFTGLSEDNTITLSILNNNQAISEYKQIGNLVSEALIKVNEKIYFKKDDEIKVVVRSTEVCELMKNKLTNNLFIQLSK